MFQISGLDTDAIEQINAHGPYSHSVWTNGAVTVTAEEALTGRGTMLVREIRNSIARHYAGRSLDDVSILDIGCYDGWVLHQLSDLPFRRMVGIEPRAKNITKGHVVRQHLGIESRCEFMVGDIDSLEQTLKGEAFDIVICTGLLHHLPSSHAAIGSLRRICRGLLFLETICLSPTAFNKQQRRKTETKDIMYFFGGQEVGLSAQKLESNYYDGSATAYTVVSIPSVDTLKMSLTVQGFAGITQVVTPEAYRNEIRSWRAFDAVCITASPDPSYDPSRQVADWVERYEKGLLTTVLPLRTIESLHARICKGREADPAPISARLLSRYIRRPDRLGHLGLKLVSRYFKVSYTHELLKNLRFNPTDKLRLEYAKCLMADGRDADAVPELLAILHRLNADWRAVYRASCLLSWCYRRLGNADGAVRYADLCRTANAAFPEILLTGGVPEFHDAALARKFAA